MGAGERGPVRVCWVPGSHEGRIATGLAEGHDRVRIVEARPADVVQLLAGGEVDAAVSGQDLHGTTGVDLLRSVRADFPEIPFILYPRRGDEQVASGAITADATEYLPGGSDGVDPAAVSERVVAAVTEYRRSQQFRKSERRYQTMLDTVGDVVYTLDSEGVVTTANDAAVQTTGYDRAELVGEHVSTVLDDADVAAGERLIQELVETDRDRGTVEMTVRTADGDTIPCENHIALLSDPDGEFAGTVGVMRDISERKRRERVLQSLHDSTREMMAAETPDQVAAIASRTADEVLDLPLNGVFLYEGSADALVSAALSDRAADIFEPPIRFERDEGLAWEVYRSGELEAFAEVHGATTVYNPDTPVQSEIVLPLGDHGVVMVGSTEPDAITESDLPLAKVLAANTQAALTAANREQALREREATLERQNDRLEQFASVVSHDLRNPLNVAQGRLELFVDTGDREHVEKVADAHERMGEIIDEVLTLARKGQTVSALEPVDVERVARAAWDTVATDGAQLRVADPPVVPADPERLKRLLENLFRNAVEHSSTNSQQSGDAVEHSSTSPQQSGDAVRDGDASVRVHVGAVSTADDTAGFYVADDGPGIPPSEREHVFESGYSNAESGTGFGLAIVDQIATAHGWDVSVTDSEWGGARFDITAVDDP
jgi:PAS domain S-box-containing protein